MADHASSLRLDSLAGEVVDSLKINAEQNSIHLETDLSEAAITGNGELVVQLIENLVQNAITYNRKDGKVKVSVRTEDD